MRPGREHDPFHPALILTGAWVAALHVTALASVPAGQQPAEAAMTYAGWCLGHHGAGVSGGHLPLLTDTGGASPTLVPYVLAPFLALGAQPSPYLARTAAAIAGSLVAVLAARLGWRWTRSRGVALITLVSAGVMPILFLQSRLADTPIFVALEMMAVLVVLLEDETLTPRRTLLAGCALLLMALTSAVGLAVAPLVAVAALAVFRSRVDRRSALGIALPTLTGVVLAAVAAAVHGVDIAGRLGGALVTAHHSGIDAVGTLVTNAVRYLGADLLFTQGDGIPGHTTGYDGVLLITTLPALLAGAATIGSRLREPRSRFLIAATAAAMAPALAGEGVSATRAIAAVPCLIAVSVLGWSELWPLIRRRRWAIAAAAAAGVIVATGFLADTFTTFPSRSAVAFDTGLQDALAAAHRLAAGRTVWVSANIPGALAEAEVALGPDCDGHQAQSMGVVIVPPAELSRARPGDIIVVAHASDPVPTHSELLFSESAVVHSSTYYPEHTFPPRDPGTSQVDIYDVYAV